MNQWIKEVARGKKGSKDLTYEQALEAAQEIISGQATDAQIAAFLIAERLKTESAEEVLAFTVRLREAAARLQVQSSVQKRLVDFAGPYNGRNAFAATIPSAVLLAQSGMPVYLHSSDSLPPKNGVSLKAILSRLGIPVSFSASQTAKTIESVRIGFIDTEHICPPLAALRSVRQEIGVRTFLNTAEKILNLSDAHAVMVGVFHKTVVDLNVSLIRSMGYEKGYIVQGVEGSEDLPIHRKSFLYEVTQDSVRHFEIDPADYDLKRRKEEGKEPLTLEQQTNLIERILRGEDSEEIQYYRAQVLYNTGVRYSLFGQTSTISEGIAYTQEQLKQGKGAEQLESWKKGCLDLEGQGEQGSIVASEPAGS